MRNKNNSTKGKHTMGFTPPTTGKHFCLYKKDPPAAPPVEGERKEGEEEVSVSVVVTDLDEELEGVLRKHVVSKASKNLIYKTGTINGVSSPSPHTPSTPPSPSKGNLPSHLVCFLALLELAGEHLDVVAEGEEEEGGEAPKRTSREYYIGFLCETDNDHSLSLYPLLPPPPLTRSRNACTGSATRRTRT